MTKSISLNEYPSYDSQAPQTAMIPLPPAILPVDQGGSSVGGGGSGGILGLLGSFMISS